MIKIIVCILAILTTNCFGQSIWTKPGDIFYPGTNTTFTPVGIGHWKISSSGSGGGGSGVNGTNATVSVGSTTTLPAGSLATVVNSGSSLNAILQFGIPRGVNGTNGLNGTNGAVGPTGPSGGGGTNGVNGLSGTNGATGPQGIPGINGTNGVNGLNGTNGVNGINGTNGVNGINGVSGTNGVNGAQGPVGPAGAGTDLMLSNIVAYASSTNFNIDFAVQSQTWTATNFSIRYSTNWQSATNSRVCSILINRTNFQRVVSIYDAATNWSTFGFTYPTVIPAGYTAKIEAQVFGLGETNVFVKMSLQNTPSWGSEIGFNPASIPGMTLWLDAGRGIYTDAGLTTNAVNGSIVKGWSDQSGNGNNVTNSLASAITYNVNGGPNGTPVLIFGGGSAWASTLKTSDSKVNYAQPNYMFCVFWFTGNNGYFLGNIGANAFVDSANTLKMSNGAGLTSSAFITSGVWREFVEFQNVGATVTTVVLNGAYPGDISSGTSPINSFCIGGATDGTYQLSCKISEIIVYNAQLSGQNLTNVMQYLRTKYSLY